jgi:hypothetical protein
MAGKTVWVTWLPAGEGAPEPDEALGKLARVGLQVSGAKWNDDLEKMAWFELGAMLLEPGKADLWVVAGRRQDFAAERLRYGLSLVSAMLREGLERPMPAFAVGLDGAPEADGLPTLLRGMTMLDGSGAAWPSKVVAAGYARKPPVAWDVRFTVLAHPLLGQWFEVGPREGEWQGAMFGVEAPAKVSFQAVGPRGELPERTTLEYPMEGIQAQVAGRDFVAWATQNRLGADQSYFVKVEGFPHALLFGPLPEGEEAEMTVVELA